jgi:Na+-driven multidrug efflux pump
VTGAAVATTIGRGTGAAYAIWRLTQPRARPVARRAAGRAETAPDLAPRPRRRRRPRRAPRRRACTSAAATCAPTAVVLASIVRVSAAGVLQSLIGTASWIGLVRIIATFGASALAGYTIAIRVVIFALLPAWGLSNAAATLVGQSLGAKDPARAERAVWTTGHYNAVFLGTVGALFVLAAPWIVGAFTRDPAVAPIAVRCLRVVALGFVFYAYGMVFTAAFNGAGDTRTPTWLNVLVFWLFEIPLAWVLAVPLGWGPTGVFVAIAVAFSVLAVLSAVLFRRGRWKTMQV